MSNVTEKTEKVRIEALSSFIDSFNADHDDKIYTSQTQAEAVTVIPTGAFSLDVALGIGGLPRGRIIELYGPEGSGKTSLALSACANAIKLGGVAGFIDVEHALTPDHVEWMGIDDRFFAISQPNSGNAALRMVKEMCESSMFSIVVIDSVASLIPQAELDGEIGDVTMAKTAQLMSSALRQIAAVAGATNTMVIFINQLREKPGFTMGNPEYTPGGRSLKFYSSVRLEVRAPASERIKEGTGKAINVLGQVCHVTVIKNKMSAPFKKCEYRLMYGEGIDGFYSVVDAAVGTGVWISKAGGTYIDAATGEAIGRGKDNVVNLLKETPEMYEGVVSKVQKALSNEKTFEETSSETANETAVENS